MKLYVLSAGTVYPLQTELKHLLAAYFTNLTVMGLPDVLDVPHEALDPARGQYDADVLAAHYGHELRRGATGVERGALALVVFPRDVFRRHTRYAYGSALPGSGVAVVNAFRLDPRLHTHQADDALWLARIFKESLHYLGHAMGLPHCARVRCVMHHSPRREYVDRKEPRYCRSCAAKLF